MKKRFWIGLATLVMCLTAAIFKGSEPVKTSAIMREKTYTFDMNITVSGTVGSAIQEQSCTIGINGGTSLVRPIAAGTDITDWFMGSETVLPAGLKVTVTEDAGIGAKQLKIKFSGTVYGASQDTIKMQPQNIYFDETESDWYAYASVQFSSSNPAPKFNIVRNFTVPSGYSSVSVGLYIKDQKNGTAGWKLEGEKGKPITQNNEMDVVIDGNFLVPMSAGYNVSSWFTGELYYYDNTTGLSRTSALPDGITVKLKNAVNVGDNSFTLVFSGTPTKGSKNLIAFTIPAGFVSYNRMSVTRGDWQSGCKITNTTGKYCYNITTTDSDELHSEFIKITYPDVEIEAGKTITEADNLIVELEICGEVNGVPITFTGITKNKTTIRGMSYQTPSTGAWNDILYTSLGLEAKVFEISDNQRTIRARIYGTPKKQRSYPASLTGRGYTLNSSYNSAGHLISGFTSGDGTITVVEPTIDSVTVSKDITIIKAADEEEATVSSSTFTISLGDEALAADIPQGKALKVFYNYTHNSNSDYSYNGLTFYLDEAAQAGDKELKVRLYTRSSNMSTFKGYLELSLPGDYLVRTKGYGYQSYYDIPFSRIYVDVEKTEHEWVKISDFTVNGIYSNEYIEKTELHEWIDQNGESHSEMETYVTGIELKPIGKGKVRSMITST